MPSFVDWSDPTDLATGGTGNLPATNELPVDMYHKTYKAFPATTPLLSVMTRLGEDPAHNYRIDWQEEKEIPTTVNVATTESSATTTVYVAANAKTLVKDTLLFNPRTWDLRKVSSTPTTDTTVSVAVSQGGTTSAAWKSGDVLHVLPPAVAENDDDTYRAVSVADENVYNYVHLIRMNYCLTRLMDKMKTHFGGAGTKRDSLKAQKYREFRIKMEKLISFGGRASSGTAPASYYMMGGLVHYLRNGTLYKNFNGLMTESGFRSFLGDYKDQNPDATNVMCFVAGNIMDVIDGWGIGKIRISPMSKKLGLDVNTYKSRGLTVNLIPMPLFTDPVTRGFGFLLDMERIKLRWVDKPMFFPEAKNVGESELIYDLYRAVMSLMLANESRHAMFVNALV